MVKATIPGQTLKRLSVTNRLVPMTVWATEDYMCLVPVLFPVLTVWMTQHDQYTPRVARLYPVGVVPLLLLFRHYRPRSPLCCRRRGSLFGSFGPP